MNMQIDTQTNGRKSPGFVAHHEGGYHGVLAEELFANLLCLERKRSERSRKQFALMLIDAGEIFSSEQGQFLLQKALSALSISTRETDIIGWQQADSVIGIIYTELAGADTLSIMNALLEKVTASLSNNLPSKMFSQVRISYHLFPEGWDEEHSKTPANSKLYPDLAIRSSSKRFSRLAKRTVDIAGSLLALVLFSPLFFIIALIIKLTSRGPVLFRQKRVGQFGETFQFLKFRSMQDRSDPKIHKEYVRSLIAGKHASGQSNGNQPAAYKLQNDPRVTPVGRFLRKTSLDELPQFWNVLKGDMSLVGPRPPIPYEVASYDIWHRRRVLEAKPGITGLWQVTGRSRTTFDEMVRLDLQYVNGWSIGLDLKILLQTPRAMLSGDGAY